MTNVDADRTSAPSPRRVSVEADGESFALRINDRPVRTPSGAPLALPARALAEGIAEELRAQREAKPRPASLLMTKLANTAIDRIAPDRQRAESQILTLAASDLLCYRAESPVELIARQGENWDPVLDWAARRHGVRLVTGSGVLFVTQPRDALDALQRRLQTCDIFELSAINAAAALMGSAILALALADRQTDAATAHRLANLDALYQAERWGQDSEAEAKLASAATELAGIARFLSLL